MIGELLHAMRVSLELERYSAILWTPNQFGTYDDMMIRELPAKRQAEPLNAWSPREARQKGWICGR